MKFGIDYFPDVHPDRVSGQQYFADVLDLAEQADQLGYDASAQRPSSPGAAAGETVNYMPPRLGVAPSWAE